jgi:hypothetical protein
MQAKVLTADKARRIAVNIAQVPELLGKSERDEQQELKRWAPGLSTLSWNTPFAQGVGPVDTPCFGVPQWPRARTKTRQWTRQELGRASWQQATRLLGCPALRVASHSSLLGISSCPPARFKRGVACVPHPAVDGSVRA